MGQVFLDPAARAKDIGRPVALAVAGTTAGVMMMSSTQAVSEPELTLPSLVYFHVSV